jgi:2,3-bisphosphoglycerate-independent phosphoglycerate mutase
MDRAKNWKRTKLAYELLVEGKGISVDNPIKAFSEMYDRGFTDEFLPPVVVDNPKKPPAFIESDDVVVFFNCRSDRARQLAKPFVQPKFEKNGGFKRKKVLKKIFMVSFTDFGENLDHILNAFPHAILENTLTCALAGGGLSQLYMAETEKYAHITYFLNGGSDRPRCGESRLKIPSLKVSSFGAYPKMSTPIIAKKLVELIKWDTYNFYGVNFANADMVSHTGNFAATILGIEAIDHALKQIYQAVVHRGGTIIITADHGNAEVMFDESGVAETRHNVNPVPFFLINKNTKGKFTMLNKHGKLSQVAPTLLEFAGIKKPKEMTGRSLLNDK